MSSSSNKQQALNPKNEKLAQAFEALAAYEFQHGGLNTGAGASYSKIAMAIRDVDDEITSGKQAMQYRDIGEKSAAMIDEYFEKGHISKPATKKVPGHDSDTDSDESSSPRQSSHGGHGEVSRYKDRKHKHAKNPKNQDVAEAMEEYADHEFERKAGSGAVYAKIARAVRDTDEEITSGDQAKEDVRGIGDVSASKIDEYLDTGKIQPPDEK
ncbi:hypothetical protein DYB25_011828 [Aphanomyces astaci]|uniref:Crossover junction endonuclease MUS81-like HHH domain-containing protein n=2 Tax=Aphanomyces astaci TaxID=112090 RepID=A0A397D205_APHAT|nr:hypothetical protein DYB25_011828 [Aphanomyces astaci]RHY54419.1 hypothetical protein DYB38_012582 [Aphanomyces astaci]RHY75530.1 hypothetical protein DYB34_014083 [Aphanomyces astaci]RHZ03786.1 hypothetical protein DYB31_006175 [Aphanomyces astaci]RHZ34087.1 hypothetical protein DYB26_014069 [Aphanomyces astaci]